MKNCYVLAGAPKCYLDKLNNLNKQVCRPVAPTLTFWPLTFWWNVVSLSLFIGITFQNVHLSWLNLVSPLVILINVIFLSPFLYVVRMFISTVYFLLKINFNLWYIWWKVNRHLYFWTLSNQLFFTLLFFVFPFFK